MRETNIQAIDLNLLTALEALLREGSVSAAARAVGLSQPAMSRALGRLRCRTRVAGERTVWCASWTTSSAT